MSTYKAVRSLRRGLDILAALNRDNGASVHALAKAIGLHRATVYRLLETLVEEGYVRKSPSDDSYRLTLKVRALNDGFDDEAWVTAVAAPVLGDLLRKVLFPTDLCTFDRDSMLIRETTHRFSPFSVHRAMVGRRLAMLTSATGRAYLAWCGEEEREQILRLLAVSPASADGMARSPATVRAILKQVRQVGYGFSVEEAERKFSAIALPIFGHCQVVACLNLVFFTSAMSVAEAARRHLPALRDAVTTIETGLRETHTGLAEFLPEAGEAALPATAI